MLKFETAGLFVLLILLVAGCSQKPALTGVVNLSVPELDPELAPTSNQIEICVLAWKAVNISFACGNNSFVTVLKVKGGLESAKHPISNCGITEVNFTNVRRLCTANETLLSELFLTEVDISSVGTPPTNFSFRLEPFYSYEAPNLTNATQPEKSSLDVELIMASANFSVNAAPSGVNLTTEMMARYPSFIYDGGINVSLVKSVAYSFPASEYAGLSRVYFTTQKDKSADKSVAAHYATIKRNVATNRTRVIDAYIVIYEPQLYYARLADVIWHELQHNQCYSLEEYGLIKRCNAKIDESFNLKEGK